MTSAHLGCSAHGGGLVKATLRKLVQFGLRDNTGTSDPLRYGTIEPSPHFAIRIPTPRDALIYRCQSI
ncbi:hypothetical protein SNOG_06749 [Parastagonospora nodorum SN15]|uniref:Uncharacterized protein n=1 Tax=Phaeosphaeria nodorum (strain SN15 / ATCC MYA-4574 / FGSC 10173) TaxID=321614 RepID=Q0UNB5_PHANO|nr:hypothetical protein SNOG_06749 [Parastagonospora nodorum SN15]EAT85400.1 hypothetical protein SNOG_06749 [Parastagonospora nodorum SN15]